MFASEPSGSWPARISLSSTLPAHRTRHPVNLAPRRTPSSVPSNPMRNSRLVQYSHNRPASHPSPANSTGVDGWHDRRAPVPQADRTAEPVRPVGVGDRCDRRSAEDRERGVCLDQMKGAARRKEGLARDPLSRSQVASKDPITSPSAARALLVRTVHRIPLDYRPDDRSRSMEWTKHLAMVWFCSADFCDRAGSRWDEKHWVEFVLALWWVYNLCSVVSWSALKLWIGIITVKHLRLVGSFYLLPYFFGGALRLRRDIERALLGRGEGRGRGVLEIITGRLICVRVAWGSGVS